MNLFPDQPIAWMALWLLTYALHSTVLLGGVWLLEKTPLLRANAAREWLWKVASIGALVTASLQLSLPLLHQTSVAAPLTAPVSDLSLAAGSQQAPAAALPNFENSNESSAHAAIASSTQDLENRQPVTHSPQPIHTQPAEQFAYPPIRRPQPVALPIGSLAVYLVLAWSIVACALFARALVSAGRQSRILQGREPLRAGRAFNQLRTIALQWGRHSPILSQGPVSGPLCLPSGEICIPNWASDQLDDDQLRAMLAHEFAHSCRRDPQWRLLMMALRSVFFFQPLNQVASRRLDDLAELACDNAAAQLGKGRDLARCLAHFAKRLVAQPAPAWTAAMASSEAGIVSRVERLVSGTTETGSTLSWRAKTAALGLVLGLAVLTPGLALKEARSSQQGTSVEINESLGGYTEASLSHSKDGYRLQVDLEGRIRFNEDETDIESMQNGDLLEITESTDDARIKLEFYGNDGQIKRRFEVDGEVRAWDAEAQAHFERLLPKLFREFGLNMEERVARLLRHGGAKAVIGEIELIEGDYVAASYVSLLMDQVQLGSSDLTRLLMATESIGSDYELRRALSAILTTQELNQRLVAQVLKVGGSIGSDYEARVLLDALAPRLVGDARDGVKAYLAMAEEIGSDYEQRLALTGLLSVDGLHPDDLKTALEAARMIGSDYELRLVLNHVAPKVSEDAQLTQTYLDVMGGIGGSHEKRLALDALAAHADRSAESLRQMLAAAAQIGSDYESAEAFLQIASLMPADNDLAELYLHYTDQIGSDYERERAQRAMRDLLRSQRDRQGRSEGRRDGRHEGRSEGQRLSAQESRG